MHPLTGPDNDASTPPVEASEAPPVCIRSIMAGSSPKSNKTTLSPLLLSKLASEAGKHEKNGAKKGHQLMLRASNDALDRIDTLDTKTLDTKDTKTLDTKGGCHALKPLMAAHVLAHVRGTLTKFSAKRKKSQWNEKVSHELLRDDFVSCVRTILHLVLRRARNLECQYRGTSCAVVGSLFVQWSCAVCSTWESCKYDHDEPCSQSQAQMGNCGSGGGRGNT